MGWLLQIVGGGKSAAQHVLVEPGPIIVGRERGCTIRLDDARVSRRHCALAIRQSRWSVQDLGSRNGTFVNGQKIGEVDLNEGDTILVGDTRLWLRSDEDAAADLLAETAADEPEPNRQSPSPGPTQEFSLPSEPVGQAFLPADPVEQGASAQTIGQRYELGSLLHRGSTGDFYVARDLESQQCVCVKLLAESVTGDEDELDRFVRGVQTAGKLQHPNIVQLYRAGHSGSQWWLAMEYVDGPSVRQLVAQYGVGSMLAPARVLAIARDVVAALGAAFERQVLHRNIKPDSILLTKAGAAKLGNFSLARGVVLTTLQRITDSGELVGDLAYMAPERTDPKGHVDCRSDIYSLGACLYSLLTGRQPFTGRGTVDLIEKIRHEAPEPPSRFQLSVPRPLEAVVLKCLAKSPTDRYPTPAALRAELERAAQFQAL